MPEHKELILRSLWLIAATLFQALVIFIIFMAGLTCYSMYLVASVEDISSLEEDLINGDSDRI